MLKRIKNNRTTILIIFIIANFSMTGIFIADSLYSRYKTTQDSIMMSSEKKVFGANFSASANNSRYASEYSQPNFVNKDLIKQAGEYTDAAPLKKEKLYMYSSDMPSSNIGIEYGTPHISSNKKIEYENNNGVVKVRKSLGENNQNNEYAQPNINQLPIPVIEPSDSEYTTPKVNGRSKLYMSE